jgi:Nif-specific regulatory protein
VAQNCGALPENLLESELFGHTKGSFTGADRDKKGLFDLADGGTIFLDEVGEMPGSLQAKLLRVLQEGEIWPLGASRPKKVNVRVLSATHCNLQEMVQEGRFRQDLFYRLHVYPIHLPPLRDRGDDITLIAHYFLKRYSHEFGRGVSGFSDESMRALIHHSWPGNVRELQNEIQRALISRFEGDLILIDDISPHISGVDPQTPDVMRETLNVQGTLKEMMEYLEKQLLQRALGDHNNNKTHTAKALGITREGLHKKLNRFSI